MSERKGLKSSTPRMTRALLLRMLIQKFDDGVLAQIDLDAVHLDFNFARRKAPLGLNAPKLGDDVLSATRRNKTDDRWSASGLMTSARRDAAGNVGFAGLVSLRRQSKERSGIPGLLDPTAVESSPSTPSRLRRKPLRGFGGYDRRQLSGETSVAILP
jgi:hypothetical protein